MSDRQTAIEIAVPAAAATIGLVTWIATMASAPRYSFGAEEDMGSSDLYWLLLGAAVVGGFLFPRQAGLIGMMLGLPSLLLSPWTAPRGDDDGLWILIVPFLGLFMFALVAVGAFGAWIRTRVGTTRKRATARQAAANLAATRSSHVGSDVPTRVVDG